MVTAVEQELAAAFERFIAEVVVEELGLVLELSAKEAVTKPFGTEA